MKVCLTETIESFAVHFHTLNQYN